MIINIGLDDLEYLTLEQLSETMDLEFSEVVLRGIKLLHLLQSGGAKLIIDLPGSKQDINTDIMYDRWVNLEAEKSQI